MILVVSGGGRDRLANAPTQEQGEITVTGEEVLKVVRKTKSNKAVGSYRVKPNVLRKALWIFMSYF